MTTKSIKPPELLVAAIKNGTVIDHITAGQALKIVRFLSLPKHKKVVTLGLNLPSKAMGIKDIVKVEGRELTPEEVNEVAIVAPKASVNIIRNYQIAEKFKVTLPEFTERFVICPNKACITNHEAMGVYFYVKPEGKEVKLKCRYCEKEFVSDEN